MSFLEVTYKEIERLNPLQLTQLLRKLLHLECDAHGILRSAVNVSLKINEPDQGEDGRAKWTDGLDHTEFIPSRFTLFQSKVGNMTRDKCEREVRVRRKNELKPKIAEVLDQSGTYLLFCGKSFKDKASRLEGLRLGLKNAGREDWDTAKLEVYDGEKIAEWTNRFFPAVVFVHEKLGPKQAYSDGLIGRVLVGDSQAEVPRCDAWVAAVETIQLCLGHVTLLSSAGGSRCLAASVPRFIRRAFNNAVDGESFRTPVIEPEDMDSSPGCGKPPDDRPE